MLDLSFRFDFWFNRLPASPRDAGRVKRLVVRPAENERCLVEQFEVTSARGADGDAWATYEHAQVGNEISIINVHVIEDLASGDAERTALSGDNLQIDLDLSEENLPVGSILEIGEARLKVSPIPHRPCLKFVERFGANAAKKVARANRKGRRGRGLLCSIEREGAIRVGDEVRVVRPS